MNVDLKQLEIKDNNESTTTNNTSSAAATTLSNQIKSIYDEKESNYFSDCYCEVAKTVFADALTTLTEFILERDFGTIEYQLNADLKRNPDFFNSILPKVKETKDQNNKSTNKNDKNKNKNKNSSNNKSKPIVEDPSVIMNRMMLLFGVATGRVDILKLLLDRGASCLVNVPDPISKLTPLHIACMQGNSELVELLEKHGADINLLDAFRAKPIDYAYLRGLKNTPNPPSNIAIYNHKGDQAHQQWSVDRLERELSIVYCSRVMATTDYLVEMCFSSFEINADMEFRQKYLSTINKSGGESNVILGWISEQVGWGVFAARDIKRGEFIVRYGGRLTMNEKMATPCYNMMTSMEDFGLDAYRYRSLGGMINHSSKHFNAESECIFEYGAEQAMITATKFIPKGTQIFINYSDSFWRPEDKEQESDNTEEMIEMGGTSDYPSIIKTF